MSAYPTIRNPLLPSPPPNASRSRFLKTDLFSTLSLSSTASLTSTMSSTSIRSFVSHTLHQISNASNNLRIGSNKRIRPSNNGMQKSFTDKDIGFKTYIAKKDSKENEPLVHYNGPFQTLESLPIEKLNWIKDEQISALIQNPLTNYDQSIVLRKPITRSQTYASLAQTSSSTSKVITKPRGMFYLRILQIIATDSSKTRLFRCGVQVNQETCYSSFATSEKTGKRSCVAQFDETFLFDIDDHSEATICVYAQNKSGNIFHKNQKQETCIGQEIIKIPLAAKSKSTERFVLNSNLKANHNNDFQLLVVHGTFVSTKTQKMLDNSIHFEDYINVYVNTNKAPRLERFWGVLRGIQFELYDVDYKENRPPLYIIPFDNFISAYDRSEEDEEDLKIDIGAKGITLQFTERAIRREDREWVSEELEHRMYLCSESTAAAREWEKKFNFVGSIYDELRGWDGNDSSCSHYSGSYRDSFSSTSSLSENDEGKLYVPLKLLW